MRHFTVHFSPDNRTVQIHAGATLLEAAGQAGIILNSPCGGVGRCGKCKVKLLPSGKEVLACQFKVNSDLQIEVPSSSRFLTQQILQHGLGRDVQLDPAVRKVFLPGPWRGIEAFCDSVSKQADVCLHLEGPDEQTLEQDACELLGKTNPPDGLTVVLFAVSSEEHTQGSPKPCFRAAAIEPGDTTDRLFGAAADIGTTTVVVNLLDLTSDRVVATAAAANPQGRYGADVISRIHYANQPNGAAILQEGIVECLRDLIAQTAQTAKIRPTEIYEIVAVGNTTMNHLLLNRPVGQLGQAPYRAYSVAACTKNAAEMNLNIAPHGRLYTLENIAGFVGSDTVAAALACGLDLPDGPTLLVDIGTNGELVLRAGEQLWAASCAAGPALEGSGITFGSSAQDGAIQRVLIEEGKDIATDVIGGGPARSICGSGLIDAVAVLLDVGILDETGRFADPKTIYPPLAEPLAQRLIDYGGQPAFCLSNPEARLPVVLTQKDIRQFQLAKAAIRAGIRLLCQHAKLPEDKLSRILLAGAFGNYIRRENAVRVGLLPGPGVERIRFVGNAAGAGAQMTLLSRPSRRLASLLARRIQYVEIAHQIAFQNAFSECLLFA
jgi:uncharacterized 2Fe-2S/4Fe-4S cluster protein (DUF4445 family)